jgi:hypothetical protein
MYDAVVDLLASLLRRTISSPENLSQTEEQLSELRADANLSVALRDIVVNPGYPTEIRHSALTQLQMLLEDHPEVVVSPAFLAFLVDLNQIADLALQRHMEVVLERAARILDSTSSVPDFLQTVAAQLDGNLADPIRLKTCLAVLSFLAPRLAADVLPIFAHVFAAAPAIVERANDIHCHCALFYIASCFRSLAKSADEAVDVQPLFDDFVGLAIGLIGAIDVHATFDVCSESSRSSLALRSSFPASWSLRGLFWRPSGRVVRMIKWKFTSCEF